MNHSRAFLITITALATVLATALPFAHAQSPLLAPVAAPAPNTQNAALRGTGILPVEHSFPPTTPLPQATTPTSRLGLFDSSADIGTVLHPGTTKNISSNDVNAYVLNASGENIWSTADAFQFAYKKTSGDIDLAADISFVGAGANPHRKAVLMIRQSLDANSPYVDAALHGSGLLSLQYRDVAGGPTTEIETLAPQIGLPLRAPNASPVQTTIPKFSVFSKAGSLTEPIRIRFVKRGNHAYLYMALKPGDPLTPSGASIPLAFTGGFYVGIGLSSHDKDVTEQAIFSNVTLKEGSSSAVAGLTTPQLYSTLEVIDIDSTIRHIQYVEGKRFEAPNWMHDGSAFLLNRNGKIWRYPSFVPVSLVPANEPVTAPNLTTIDTGFATRCNNDHGISPDGTQIVISDNSQDTHDSLIYTLPITGATAANPPHRITAHSPSYWHGWSPDGKTLAFVGQRNGDFDIYTVPADATNSQDETRLTTAKGLDDGPEYTPDGQWIYFNSERTGHMQIWRMHGDGSAQEQVTHDDWNNWFPHFSPDGKWMVMLSYDKSVTGHPENKDVQLRLMSMADGKIITLARLFGGQGTINVPSWSPDSKHLAFVSYELLPHDDATPTEAGANQ